VKSEINELNININQMKIKLDQLAKHKYDPKCNYCITNIFVRDAMNTQNKMDGLKIKLDELNGVLEGIELNQDKTIKEKYSEIIQSIKTNKETIKEQEKLQHEKQLLEKDKLIVTKEIEQLNDSIQTVLLENSYREHNENIQKDIKEIENCISGIEKEFNIDPQYVLFNELRDKLFESDKMNHQESLTKIMEEIKSNEKYI
jgi:Fe-S-cluster formation regulator IscX/YfhJ